MFLWKHVIWFNNFIYQVLLDEMKVHRQKSDQICKSGSSIKANEPSEIQSRIDSLQSNWDSLNGLSQLRTKQLQDAAEAYQVIQYL